MTDTDPSILMFPEPCPWCGQRCGGACWRAAHATDAEDSAPHQVAKHPLWWRVLEFLGWVEVAA